MTGHLFIELSLLNFKFIVLFVFYILSLYSVTLTELFDCRNNKQRILLKQQIPKFYVLFLAKKTVYKRFQYSDMGRHAHTHAHTRMSHTAVTNLPIVVTRRYD